MPSTNPQQGSLELPGESLQPNPAGSRRRGRGRPTRAGNRMAGGSDSEYLAYVNGRVTALRRTAYLLCGDAHEADDIVQETLTKLYVRWPRRHSVDNLDAYVNTMLVRNFVDGRRRGWWKV